MTIFGPDISSYQAGLDLSRLTQASFVIAKASEGTYYTDADYQGWRAQAAHLGLPFAWYHFLSGEPAAAQAAHTLACVGDRSLPGMLDVEEEGSFFPTFAQVLAYADAAHAAGLNLRLVYLPHWVWVRMGSPDLSPLTARRLYLVASSYPGGSGSPTQVYPGDSASGWAPYGGVTPLLYQFTNAAYDGGQALDYNAFRGSRQQLLAFLGSSSAAAGPPSSTGGFLMALSDADQARLLNDANNLYSLGFLGGPSCGTIPPGGANNSLVVKIDYLIAAAQHGVPAVDVAALAAALGPLLHPTTDVSALAAALVPHLPGAPDPGAFAQALAGHIKVV